ncbi:MAG: hypothetical protein KQH57_07970 [Actinomycetales bacterium]|nr:hypothetical protein [Actinomycetales bacterium]
MTTGRTAMQARALRSPWWWLGAVVVSVVVVVALAGLDTAVAHGRDDLHALHYGTPVAWAVQDSTLDPPTFPFRAPFSDPRETVTHVLGPQLGLDAVLVLALLVGTWSLLALGLRATRARADRAAGGLRDGSGGGPRRT